MASTEADIVFAMPISSDYCEALSTEQLRSISRAPFVIHPNCHYEAYYPSFDYVRDTDNKHISISNFDNPHWDYLCHISYALFVMNISIENAAEALRRPMHIDLVKRMAASSLLNLKSREDFIIDKYGNTDLNIPVRFSSLLGQSSDLSSCFHTFNHPSPSFLGNCLKLLIDSFCHSDLSSQRSGVRERLLGLRGAIGESLIPAIPTVILPVYPFVSTSLGFPSSYNLATSYNTGKPSLTLEESISACFAAYALFNTYIHEAIVQSWRYAKAQEITCQLMN